MKRQRTCSEPSRRARQVGSDASTLLRTQPRAAAEYPRNVRGRLDTAGAARSPGLLDLPHDIVHKILCTVAAESGSEEPGSLFRLARTCMGLKKELDRVSTLSRWGQVLSRRWRLPESCRTCSFTAGKGSKSF